MVETGQREAGPWVWRCAAFDALTARELYALLALRERVFVVEQRCAYQDADGYDPRAWHVWAERAGAAGEASVIAVARFFAPGIKYEDASFGRVVSAPEVRGTGVGRALVGEVLARMRERLGPTAVRISAQAHLARFYGEFGFEAVRGPYMEDDIPHVEMLRPAGLASAVQPGSR